MPRSERDLRTHAMRSKLLSLHLVLTVLRSHSDLFTNPLVSIPSNSSLEMTPFLQATKQYLCLSLSRNAVSPVNQVFELSVEIFWCMLKSMRAQMKVSRPFFPWLIICRKRSKYCSTRSSFPSSECAIPPSDRNQSSSACSSGYVRTRKPSLKSTSIMTAIERHWRTFMSDS